MLSFRNAGEKMLGLDNLDTLFVIWAFFFQAALIIHFVLRK
jgi:hypothetical protein